MAWYRCTKDNSYDGVNNFRNGREYDLPGTPPAAYFTAVTASAIRNDDREHHAQTDLDQCLHIYDCMIFENKMKLLGDIYTASVAVSSSTTITTTDKVYRILVTTGASDITITLPSASLSENRELIVVFVSDGGGDVVLSNYGTGSDTLRIEFQESVVVLHCDGTTWRIGG